MPSAQNIMVESDVGRNMDLFEYNRRDILSRQAPLASRMRPEHLDDI